MSKQQILGLGIGLIDIIIDGSQDLLLRYGLAANGELKLREDQLSIFQDVRREYYDQIFVRPGGTTLNTLRVIQWYLEDTGQTTIIGSINDDETGRMLRKSLQDAGVTALFQLKREAPTGQCLVICTGSNRSLVTYGGASFMFTDDFFDLDQTKNAVARANYFYSTAYSLISCGDSVRRLATHSSQDQGKLFALNLAAVYVCQQYCHALKAILPFVDVLFGNKAEAIELSKALDLQTEICEDIAIKLANWKREGVARKPRIVVITQGPSPAVLAIGEQIQKFTPASIKDSEIVDANGAGDAFVGGFLSALMHGKSPEDCMLRGHQAAGLVLRERGCNLPNRCVSDSLHENEQSKHKLC